MPSVEKMPNARFKGVILSTVHARPQPHDRGQQSREGRLDRVPRPVHIASPARRGQEIVDGLLRARRPAT